MSLADKAKLMALFRLAADHAAFSNPEKFGDLGDGLREFKSHQIRMPFAYAKNERSLILITHGFVKKKNKAPNERNRTRLAHLQGRSGVNPARHREKGKTVKTQYESLMENPEFAKLVSIETLLAQAADTIARLMAAQNVTKADLARRLNKSRAWVTQLLNGSSNLTIRTLAEVAYALDAELSFSAQPRESRR